MISIYNGNRSKVGFRVDGEDMSKGGDFYSVYLAALINRLGGEVEFTAEELDNVKQMDVYCNDENRYFISSIKVNQEPEGQTGHSLDIIYVASDYREKLGFWSFEYDEGSEETKIFVPEGLSKEDKVAFINTFFADVEKGDYQYVGDKPNYHLLKKLDALGKLERWDKVKLDKLENPQSEQVKAQPKEPSVFAKVTNLFK